MPAAPPRCWWLSFTQNKGAEKLLYCISISKLKNTAAKTRRYDVLADIIQRNGFEGASEKRANTIKILLRDYRTMSGTLRQALMDLGFTVTEDGKHYRLTYYGDGRYKTTVSKTASDHREGKNIASTIIKNMF